MFPKKKLPALSLKRFRKRLIPPQTMLPLRKTLSGDSEETLGSWETGLELEPVPLDVTWLEAASGKLFSSSAQAVIGDIWRTNRKDSKSAVALNAAFFITNPLNFAKNINII